ncbi:MAG: oligosaccharide flippase family protein [Bacteroidales bacterium]|nr:oligosaccharide flippase family protein [Bacteroidales bacterium]
MVKKESKLRQFTKRYDFLKNVMVLLSGSSIALLISFLITPVLTRFFSPEDFGLWGTYSAVVGIFTVIACGRYELALLLPKKEKEAFNMFAGSLLIAIVLSVLLLFPIYFFGEYFCEKLGASNLYQWLYLVPPAVLTGAIIQAANYWHNRNKKFNVLSAGRIIQSSSTAATNLAIGKFAYFGGGLIVSTILGQALLSIYYIVRMRIFSLWKYVSISEIKTVLIKYRDFPLKSGAGIFLNILKEQIPIFLLLYYFDAVIVGYYALIIRLFNVPLSLVAGSIGQVYYQKAVEMNNDGKSLFIMYKKTTLRLLLVLVIPVALVMIWGASVFGFVFGAEWDEAGKFLVIFAVYYALRFVISSQSSLLLVFKKLGIELSFNFVALILQVSSIIIGALQNDYYLSLYLMSISGSVIYALLGIYLWVYLKTKK